MFFLKKVVIIMGLRNRQISGVQITPENARTLTFVLALVIPVLGYMFWFPLFGVPEEFRLWFAVAGMLMYIYQCSGRVPVNLERAQLYFGSYTGISFPAGIYFLPRLPFPIVSMFLILIKEDIRQYLGWVLEGDVTLKSITTTFSSEGLTSDGVRVRLEGNLAFEVSNAPIFLSQKGDTENITQIQKMIGAEVSFRIKQQIIAMNSVKSLYRGDYEASSFLTEWITETCYLDEDFGVRLSRVPVVYVQILSERVQKAFDADSSKSLLRDVSNETADAFADFVKRLPPGTSEEVALAFFNTARMNEGLLPVDINVIKFK